MSGIAEIQHYSHEHQLKLVCNQSRFKCNGCKELGIGSCYQCKHNCDFYLHEECALIASNYITHPFFKNCHFIFHDASQSGFAATRLVCVACGKNVQGFMYWSSTNKPYIVLHPCCFKLPHHRVHDHGVTVYLREMLSHTSKKCQICRSRTISKETRGWVYVSNCGKCRYHVACARDMIFDDCWNNVRALQTTGGVENKSKLRLVAQQLGLTGRNFRRYSWKMIKLIFKVIIATLTGDPLSITHSLWTAFH
ncbi:hypothetical protein SO802_016908 [Lithocarpus litseifolius]|uniref:DC1 domain-containing protein n=1 Tax=Lithocarpus litseifolius TaxID=425828 RepID=A0AAW2CXS7_9ROSI